MVVKIIQAQSKIIRPKKAEKIWSLASCIVVGLPTEVK